MGSMYISSHWASNTYSSHAYRPEDQMTILISRRQMHSRSQSICLVYRCTVTEQLVPSNKSCTKLKTRNKSVSRSDVHRFDTGGMKALLLNSPWNRRE